MIRLAEKPTRNVILGVAAVSIGWLSPDHASAKEPIVAQPASPWEIEYADSHCGLKRHFASGEDVFSLELRQESPLNGTEVILFSNSLNRRGGLPVTRLGPDGTPTKHEYFKKLKSGEWNGVALGMANEFAGSLASGANELTFTQTLERDVTLQLEGAVEALKALNACVDDLVRSWGFDPVEQRNLSRKIPEESMDWDAMFAFVAGARGRSQLARDGSIRTLYLVDANGRTTSCRILNLEVDQKKVAKACERFKRTAKFEPALDANGVPIASFVLAQTSAIRGL